MNKIHQKISCLLIAFTLASCSSQGILSKSDRLKPVYITEKVNHDTDDPAIWIHPTDPSKSLILGTDKETTGGLFAYDLTGKIVNKVLNIKRPNNVDIRYGFDLNGKKIDIAALTERETNRVRIYSLPDLTEVGSFSVFDGEQMRDPMGISLYKNPQTQEFFAVVGRKNGPSGTYLWQYKLTVQNGRIGAEVVRKFGNYSGLKEIESIAVDDELGFIYYSDEGFGVHQYYADPQMGNQELLVFGKGDFKADVEGISIYPTSEKTGYILVSNQQADSFNVYLRENPAKGRIAEIPVSTSESDGSEVTAVNLGEKFPKGIFVAMSNGKVFHIYDWRDLQSKIPTIK
ncbi:phytase [Amniculibacterium sp. G2-70]|uniref:phytase n=1 Tax=Amniculibacterium sp. G2-70 TaxID=2767188 RepID=UPI0039766A27